MAGGRRMWWNFVLANIAFPIVGADFLKHFGLVVDLKAWQLRCHGRQAIELTAPAAGHIYAAIGLVA